MRGKFRYLAQILLVAALYTAAAKLGLSLAFSVKQITTVWPPTGLALAILLLFGYRLWPGILLGALTANLLTSTPPLVALGIAVGNTLEAVVAVLFLQHIVGFRLRLDRIRDLLGLAIFSAAFSTTVSASIGTTSLALGGLTPWREQPTAWLLWWFGDMAGALLFTPFLLIWLNADLRRQLYRHRTEAAILLVGTIAVATSVFFGHFKFLGSHPPVEYLVFPFIIWAALRLKQIGVTTVSVVTAIIAVLGTVRGHGPFANVDGSVERQLVIMLLYIILITACGLFLAVSVSERERYEERLLLQTKELKAARSKILRELAFKSKRQAELDESHKRVTGILSQLLDEHGNRRSLK